MKVTKETTDDFKPITINVTFESQREINFWYHFIGNTSAHDRREITGKSESFSIKESDKFIDPLFDFLSTHFTNPHKTK